MVERFVLPNWNHPDLSARVFVQFYLSEKQDDKKVYVPYFWCSHNLINQTGQNEFGLIKSLESRIVFLGEKMKISGNIIPVILGKNYSIVGEGQFIPKENGKVLQLAERPGVYSLNIDEKHIKAINSYLDKVGRGWKKLVKV